MLSRGRRTVKSQRFGERGSGLGGGADSSCFSVSLETDCIKQTLEGQTELWPPRGGGRGNICFQQLELWAPCFSDGWQRTYNVHIWLWLHGWQSVLGGTRQLLKYWELWGFFFSLSFIRWPSDRMHPSKDASTVGMRHYSYGLFTMYWHWVIFFFFMRQSLSM